MKRTTPKLCLVIPCFNEEAVLPLTAPMFLAKLEQLIETGYVAPESGILFVDDGSKDRTWEIISELHVSHPAVSGIRLSANRGHQNALYAGMMETKGSYDAVVTMDCDGQDDPGGMDAMLDFYMEGCEVVYGMRTDRDSDSVLKRTSAHMFYSLTRKLGERLVYDHADYRLVSARALEALSKYQEVNLFLRGIFPLIGFQSACVGYERRERVAGKSKYSLSKMFTLAMDGITSFSVKPIRLISCLGGISVLVSLILILYALVSFISGHVVPGWSSAFISSALFGGVQMLCLGVIGEYVGKIYTETKHRPRYEIEDRTE